MLPLDFRIKKDKKLVKGVSIMTIDKARDIVRAGLFWANWTSEQRAAFTTLLLEAEKVEHLEKENKKMRSRLLAIQQDTKP